VRCQPPKELAPGLHLVDAQQDVRAEIRLGTIAQYNRLNLVELKRRRAS
jgi:hypothetical protein